jgi:hypothetical protein
LGAGRASGGIASVDEAPWFFRAALVGPIASSKLASGLATDSAANVGATTMTAVITVRWTAQRDTTFMMRFPQNPDHAVKLLPQLKGVGGLI